LLFTATASRTGGLDNSGSPGAVDRRLPASPTVWRPAPVLVDAGLLVGR